jgi:hypothetical protein
LIFLKDYRKPAALEFNVVKTGVPKVSVKEKKNASTEQIGTASGFEGGPQKPVDAEYDQFLKDIAKPPEEDFAPKAAKKVNFLWLIGFRERSGKNRLQRIASVGCRSIGQSMSWMMCILGMGIISTLGLEGKFFVELTSRKKMPTEIEKLEMMAYNAQPRAGPTIRRHG